MSMKLSEITVGGIEDTVIPKRGGRDDSWKDKPNYYKTPAPAEKPNLLNMKTVSRVVIAGDFGKSGPPPHFKEVLDKLIPFLKANSYEFSYMIDENSPIPDIIKKHKPENKFRVRQHKFVDEDSVADLNYPSDCAHKTAAWLLGNKEDGSSRFAGMKNFGRATIAARVNLFLGPKCNDKARFAIIYNPEGSELPADRRFKERKEKFPDAPDYWATDNIIEFAEKFGVDVFNIANGSSIERLQKYLNALHTTEEDKPKEEVKETLAPEEESIESEESIQEEVTSEEPKKDPVPEIDPLDEEIPF